MKHLLLERWESLIHDVDNLRDIILDVGIWESSYNRVRKIESALAQLWTWHSDLTHANPPECDLCQASVIFKHIYVGCAKYETAHNICYRNSNLRLKMSIIFGSSKYCNRVLKRNKFIIKVLLLVQSITLFTPSSLFLILSLPLSSTLGLRPQMGSPSVFPGVTKTLLPYNK